MTIKPPVDSSAEREWMKSSYSTAVGAECVEVACAPGAVRIRDSKDREGPQLSFSPDEWAAFVGFAADFH